MKTHSDILCLFLVYFMLMIAILLVAIVAMKWKREEFILKQKIKNTELKNHSD